MQLLIRFSGREAWQFQKQWAWMNYANGAFFPSNEESNDNMRIIKL